MKYDFKYLKWDSEFFNFKVGKLTCDYISKAEFMNLSENLKEKGYRLIYLFSQNEIEFLSKYLVDKKVTYSKKINLSKTINIDTNIKLYRKNLPNKKLIELSIQSGIYSRFRVDKNISKEKFEQLYKLWITNSVNKKIADETFIYSLKDDIVGFITIKTNPNSGTIGLIAVDQKHRGMGIGSKLIQATEHYCLTQNIHILSVVTQKDNIPACKLYEKNGFKIKSLEYVYHIWL